MNLSRDFRHYIPYCLVSKTLFLFEHKYIISYDNRISSDFKITETLVKRMKVLTICIKRKYYIYF